ncbi:MAG: virion core protein, partial [Eubacteriales bacterium]
DPLKFYAEAIEKSSRRVEIQDINEQYLNEFLEALQSAINRMSADGIRISYVTGKAQEVSRYMAEALDENWRNMRGMEIQAVGIASVSYDEESKELINLRNRGAMLSDPTVREGYVQATVAEGIKNAGSNPNGAATAFMGMGMGMNAAGNFMASASATNAQQMAMQKAAAPAPSAPAASAGWTCSCGHTNPDTAKFCADCGKAKPAPAATETWTCSCGQTNSGKFCSACGSKRPDAGWTCTCGHANAAGAKFCGECGKKRED